MRFAALALLAGCWRASPPPPPIVDNRVPSVAVDHLLTPRGAGPFTARTRATLEALRKKAPKLRVETHDLGAGSGIVFDVFEGDERLYYVVPDDAPGWTEAAGVDREYDESIFAVFAVSPKVIVEGRTWRVGAPLESAAQLDLCECWGEHEVTACFQRGAHVRVIFEHRCDDAEREGATAMVGKPISRIMWKRVVDDLPRDDEPATP